MSKIYNIIPGNLINDSTIVSRILELIDSIEFEEWLEVNENVYSLEFFQENEEFYVMYLAPGGVIERLYVTNCDDIVAFMRERVDYEHGEGIDLAVCTKEIANVVICNHDGQIFMLKAYF